MLHHPHAAQIDRISALNDSFYKTPCILDYIKKYILIKIFAGPIKPDKTPLI